MHLDFLIFESSNDWRVCGDLEGFKYIFVVLVFRIGTHRDSSIYIRTIRDDFPVIGSDNTAFVWCFQIGLVEAREDNMAEVWLKVSESVFRTVSVIFEVVEALTIVDIEAFKLDDSNVETNFLVVVRNVNAVVAPKVWSVLRNLSAVYD